MRFRFESLETRDLLAADVEVLHDPIENEEVGEEVTRTIRVFVDSDNTEVRVRSALTDQLDNPRWERIEAFGRGQLESPYQDLEPDLVLQAGEPEIWFQSFDTWGWPIGDVNGDGFEDFNALYARPDREIQYQPVILFGPLAEDRNLTALPADGSLGFELHRFVGGWGVTRESGIDRIASLGDINGDGFDDFAQWNNIVFGAADLGAGGVVDLSTLLPGQGLTFSEQARLSGVGDVDGDGVHDLLVSEETRSFVIWGHEDLSRDTVLQDPERTLINIEALIDSQQARTINGPTVFAEPVGDINDDGVTDMVVASLEDRQGQIPVLIYGGADLRTKPINFGAMAGADGFVVGNPLDVHLFNYGNFAWHVADVGDVNADQVDDFVIVFNGGAPCAGCTATDKDNFDVPAGLLLIYGSAKLARDGVFDPAADKHTTFRVSTIHTAARANASLVDMNQDEIPDIHMIAGPWGRDTRSDNYVWLGGDLLPHVDLGHASLPFSGFDGLNGLQYTNPTDSDRTTFLDVNADGIQDALVEVLDPKPSRSDGGPDHRIEVYFGRELEQAPRVLGTGNIDQTIQLDRASSVIYRVTGTLKSAESRLSTVALPVNDVDLDLRNNVVSKREAVWLDVVSAEPTRETGDDELRTDLSIANKGPANASDVSIQETITASYDNVTWHRSTQLFPASVPLGNLTGAIGVAFEGPELIRIGERNNSQEMNPQRIYWQLGQDVGSLGDINQDGIDDIYISSLNLAAADPSTAEQQHHVFLGSTSFGDGGMFPPPTTQIATTAETELSGDFNGDGRLDRISNRGVVTVRYADAEGQFSGTGELDGSNGFTVLGEPPCARNGVSIAAGDVNGDGVDDVIVAAGLGTDEHFECDEQRSQAGVYVVFGTRGVRSPNFDLREIDGANGFMLAPDRPTSHGALSIASDFDLNGDGIDDILVGDPHAGQVAHRWAFDDKHGAAYVVFGRSQHAATGNGPIQDRIDIPVGATVTYTIRGTPAESVGGRFTAVPKPTQIQLVPGANEVQLGSAILRSDFNGDGAVSFSDFLILAENYGRLDAAAVEGDANGDATVDISDFLILRAEFGDQL